MIDYLRGRVSGIEEEYVILDVRDIGYRVWMPNPYVLAEKKDPVQLFIYYHAREGIVQLFGFTTRLEQTLFRQLLEVSGIGPRIALGVLGRADARQIITAIKEENMPFLHKLPGIGKKTAQRMILDLKDKLNVGVQQENSEIQSENKSGLKHQAELQIWENVREALLGFGYRDHELAKVLPGLRSAASGEESEEELLKKALQGLFQDK